MSSSAITLPKTSRSREREEDTMKAFTASKLDDYSKGKISRRQLLESLTVAAVTTAAAGGAQAAPAPAANRALKAALTNHISHQCPDFHRVADWYSRVFN